MVWDSACIPTNHRYFHRNEQETIVVNSSHLLKKEHRTLTNLYSQIVNQGYFAILCAIRLFVCGGTNLGDTILFPCLRSTNVAS